jgi:hypothetical protein
MLLNILICTAIMWVLQTLLILPLSAFFANKHLLGLNLPGYSSGDLSYDQLPEAERTKVDEVSSLYYISADIIILGLAGFLAGSLLGVYFIGFSFDKKGWPGMAAFIIFSLLGSGIM